MKILHIVPGLNEKWNGIAVAAKLIAEGQRKDGHEADLVDAREFGSANYQLPTTVSEVWVHSMWTPMVWRACLKVLRCRAAIGVPRLVRMTHANLDPLRYRYHGWKKRLVAPFERWFFAKTDRVVVTGEWEAEWCRQWGLKGPFQVVDMRQFFCLSEKREVRSEKLRTERSLHVLYLGRRHPLKGVEFLDKAVGELNGEAVSSPLVGNGMPVSLKSGEDTASPLIELRIESSLFGEEKEKAWEWCDVFCLPTLSENFGLVVAEALEHGRPVITTDGAPAWEPPQAAAVVSGQRLGISEGQWWNHLVYLRGYREGTDTERVKLLRDALVEFVG